EAGLCARRRRLCAGHNSFPWMAGCCWLLRGAGLGRAARLWA
ncbi:hypothetical protein A2U01_0107119, partial [Trifolium medium]|nr:hypothetical protein [Trifolium medium]